MRVGIIVAMDSEYALLQAALASQKGRIGVHQVWVSKSGIGKVNAALMASELIAQHQVDCVLNTGVAGSADDSVDVMDIVVGGEVRYHDVWCGDGNEKGQVQGLPACFRADDLLLQTMRQSASDESRVHFGLICSGDKFITTADEIWAIKCDFPQALAVDMESAAIAQVCHLRNVPFLSMRVISDKPTATSDHRRQYADFWRTAADSTFGAVVKMIEMLP